MTLKDKRGSLRLVTQSYTEGEHPRGYHGHWVEKAKDNCPFCRIALGKAPAQIIHEDEHVVAFHDLKPEAPIHALVIPREHIANLYEAEPEHMHLLGRLALTSALVAKKLGAKDGFRVVVNTGEAAGQSVHHVHYHVLGEKE